MKQTLYTLIVFCAFGLLSCRKSRDNFTIKQYDDDQIKTYINNNGLTAVMKPDTTGHYNGTDTSGIYYQIITPGTGSTLAYSDKASYVYTAKSFDGGYSSTDTIFNHANVYTAYITPNGLQLAVKNIAKRKGAKIRVLIPSRLAYGINGATLSSYNTSGTVVYSTVGGNQCLDYTVTVLDETQQASYDDLSIKKYMAANGLTGYTKTSNGVYYKITQPGTGTAAISISSTVGLQYTGTLLNGTIFEQANTTDGTAAYSPTLYDAPMPAWLDALQYVTAGAKLTFITPTAMGFGQASSTNGSFTVPAFSCLRYDMNIISVTN